MGRHINKYLMHIPPSSLLSLQSFINELHAFLIGIHFSVPSSIKQVNHQYSEKQLWQLKPSSADDSVKQNCPVNNLIIKV